MAAAALVLFDAEIDRAVRRAVCHAARHQLFDQGNNVGDLFAGAGRLVGAQAVERLEILEKRRLELRRVVAQRGFVSRARRMILSSTSVMFMTCRTA